MSIFDRYARYYDLFYARKDYKKECDFLVQAWALCGVRPKEVLDLAGGTGNHGLVLAAAGYRVCAVDASAEMLWQYGKKAAELGLSVDLQRQELAKISLGRQFDAALCLGDAVSYLLDDVEIVAFFSRLREQIKPYGVFIFDFWHTPAVVRGYEPRRVREYPLPGGKVIRSSTTGLDVGGCLALVEFHVREFVGDNIVAEFTEEHRLRFFTQEEMMRFLVSAGWEIVFLCPSNEFGRTVDEDTFHVSIIARPKLVDIFSV